MDEQEIIEEFRRLEKVAGIKKNICGIMPSLGHRVRLMNTQFNQLLREEKELIRPQLEAAIDEILKMVTKINHSFQEDQKKQPLK